MKTSKSLKTSATNSYVVWVSNYYRNKEENKDKEIRTILIGDTFHLYSVEFVNGEILDQLKLRGRILTVFKEKNLGQCRLGVKTGLQVQWANLFEANCAVLNEFRNEKEFTL